MRQIRPFMSRATFWALNIRITPTLKTVRILAEMPCTKLEGDGTLSLSKEQYAKPTVYGFDVNDSSPQKIYAPDTADFMSYGRPRWPSRVNYGLLFDKFALPASPGANVKLNQRDVFANQTVIIDGIIQLNGPAGQLGSVIVNTNPATISLPSPGDYSIRLENSQGAELARSSFNPIQAQRISRLGSSRFCCRGTLMRSELYFCTMKTYLIPARLQPIPRLST